MSDSTHIGHAEPVRETEKALLVRLQGDDENPFGSEVWVPKSVIHDDSECYSMKSGAGELLVEEWWARENGF